MNLGILGGTFNPVHNGHINLAEEAASVLGLEKVVMVVSYVPPHKGLEDDVSAQDRLEMVRLAVSGKPLFEVSTFEVDRKGTSYSIKTIRHFKERYGKDVRLYFVTGADSLKDLCAWKDIDEIFRLSDFAVANRPGYSLEAEIPDGVTRINIAPTEISSSDIRMRLRKGMTVSGLLPEAVIGYINEKGLYRR